MTLIINLIWINKTKHRWLLKIQVTLKTLEKKRKQKDSKINKFFDISINLIYLY